MTLLHPKIPLPAQEAWIGLIASSAACSAPLLLAYSLSPSPTFLNQALAIVGWGGFVAWMARALGNGSSRRSVAGCWPVLAVLLLIACTALWACLGGSLPSSLALSAVGLLLAAAVLLVGGGAARTGDRAVEQFTLFCWGWLVAGLLNATIAGVQVFAPGLPDGDWIAHSGIPGRAVGNIRQPNHLSSLLVWSAVACVALVELQRLSRRIGGSLFAVLVLAVMLTASRTGMVSVLLLALWGALDRRMSPSSRWLLLSAPLIYGLGWAGMAGWAASGEHAFGGTARLAEADLSGSRFGIWSNTLELIRQQPWTGVGFGEFNFAWSLTPFPHRPTAFFDHTHNLPLQLAVELGVPLAGLAMLLLGLGLWRSWRGFAGQGGDLALTQRCALMMVLMIGLHSLLEYPLWYAYFLLPAAWAWGYALPSRGRSAPKPSRGLVWAGVTVAAAGMLSVLDYGRVVPIFEADDGAMPLTERIAVGRRSLLFSHHADYAAATTDFGEAPSPAAFAQATHYLLDTRLMMAWAESEAAQGHLERARHLAARLREFHNPAAKSFLGACTAEPPPQPPPFQCVLPQQTLTWRDFLTR